MCQMFPRDAYDDSPNGLPIEAKVLAVRMNGMVDIELQTTPKKRRDAVPYLQPGDELPLTGSYATAAP